MCACIHMCVCVCMCIYSAVIKEWNFAICNNMDRFQGILLSEISQTGRQILHNITYTWNLKIKQIREYNKKETDSDVENKLVATSGEKEGGRCKIVAGDYMSQTTM